tara:strand:- start:8201 stop:8677 length:477 start_codon:yes stop_codon:yes gene_type:complete
MAVCDMCGSSSDQLYVTSIEESELKVCKNCSSYGKITNIIKAVEKEKKVKKVKIIEKEPEIEIIQLIVNNYHEIIKNSREKKGLKQKDVAKLMNQKESVIHKVESGSLKPSIKLAQKFERFFNINLIEEHEEIHAGNIEIKEREGFTIGDMIKIRKRN